MQRRVLGALSFLFAVVVLACDSTSVRGVRLAKYTEAESQRVLVAFLAAAHRRDTSTLRSLAVERVREHVVRELSEGLMSADYRGAAETYRVKKLDILLGGADIAFTYQVGKDQRDGIASLRYQDEQWRIVRFSLRVQY